MTTAELRLGIDTGGTYTDAVLVDVENRIVASAKRLTTHHDLTAGIGAPVAVLLPGYSADQVARSGLPQLFDADLIVTLPGGHDATGEEVEPLDETATRRAIAARAGRVSAFAVSAMFGVRNPGHERTVRDWVREETQRPVTCGMSWPAIWMPRGAR
jgi:N-methylhydantoinase A/oxoprolinase/acetone carboxylase beta subunit